MVGSVTALNNASMMLYGTPYMDGIYQNPYMMSPSYNYNYNNQPNYDYAQPVQQQAVDPKDWDVVARDYAKSMEPSEGLLGAATGGATFGVLMHPRLVAHPYNSFKGLKDVKEMFKGEAFNKLWKENNSVMREAYFQMHKASSRANSKLGLFRKAYSPEKYAELKGMMDKAIKSGNIEEVAKAAEHLKQSYVSDGWIPRQWQKLTGGKPAAVDAAKVAENAKKLVDSNKMSFKKVLAHGGGVKGGLFFMGMELLMSLGKIKTAFSKDSETGMKQVGQTLVKGAGSAVGWAAGEALGIWGMAKLGAAVGTAFGPGIGTAIGGLVGIIGGSIGCCLAGKLTKKLVGEDVANKVEAENLKASVEGQVQLLQNTLQRVQKGKTSAAVTQAAIRLANAYA